VVPWLRRGQGGGPPSLAHIARGAMYAPPTTRPHYQRDDHGAIMTRVGPGQSRPTLQGRPTIGSPGSAGNPACGEPRP
jgi:hypothetical protein